MFSIGTVYGTDITITGISNANPAVATAPENGLANGDVLIVESGWSRLNQAVARAASVSAGTFQLEGYDTTETSIYPTGSGLGNARQVTTWVSMSQVTNSASSGGEPSFYTWKYMEDGNERKRTTGRSARDMTLTFDFDPSLPWHAALYNASLKGTAHVIRASLPLGGTIYWNMTVSFDGEPTFNIDQNMQVTAVFSFENPRSQRYSS